MQLVVNLIIENRNVRGANIENLFRRAKKGGMDRGEVLSDIERLKFEGHAYEPINGEI
jgi:DNA replicative helicase MCM subunit Mcm2 (Cdc46/Mcm family)